MLNKPSKNHHQQGQQRMVESYSRKGGHNQYCLPHPQEYQPKENDTQQHPREKIVLKHPTRKQSHNPTFTSPILKIQPNHSKEIEQNPSKSSTRKLEKKARSSSSGETPKKGLAKSSLKLQLTSRRQTKIPKRVTLHLDAATNKKPQGKFTLQEMNYDSYYSTRPALPESKSPRALQSPLTNPTRPSSAVCADMQHLVTRFKVVLDDYSHQLQALLLSNQALQEQNRILRALQKRGSPEEGRQ